MSVIFVHAWWRSGSTYIWSKLREHESCRCYYEPLHEKIAQLTAATVEGPPEIEESRALGHPAPTKHYFAEYSDILRSGGHSYSQELAYDRYLLLPGQEDTKLHTYVGELVSAAAAAERRAVLCFCRSQMRSAWMKNMFGGIHLAQIRNPADQWASFKSHTYFVAKTIGIALKLRNFHPHAFAHIEPFERIAQDLSKRPSLDPDLVYEFLVQRIDPLAIFLTLWIASTLQAVAHCDFVLDIDLLSTDVDYRNKTADWFASIGCPTDFSDCLSPTSSDAQLRYPLFDRALEDAAIAVRAGASSLVITDRNAVEKRLPSLSPLSRRALRLALEDR